MMRIIWKVVFAILVTSWLPVSAYIDPGSGSAIMSLIIGFFVALGLTVKTYWYKLKALFTRLIRPAGNPEPEPDKSREN